ncbi:hypothetical protein ACOSQ3_017569 [Xanthoceras sorbifolium]
MIRLFVTYYEATAGRARTASNVGKLQMLAGHSPYLAFSLHPPSILDCPLLAFAFPFPLQMSDIGFPFPPIYPRLFCLNSCLLRDHFSNDFNLLKAISKAIILRSSAFFLLMHI